MYLSLESVDALGRLPAGVEVVEEDIYDAVGTLRRTPLLMMLYQHGKHPFFKPSLMNRLGELASQRRAAYSRDFSCGRAYKVISCNRVQYEPADLELKVEWDLQRFLYKKHFFQFLRFKWKTLGEDQ